MLRRQFNIRAAETKETETGFTFTGIGVPYGDEITLPDGNREAFAPDSVTSDGALVLYRHGEVIGKVVSGNNTERGHEITGEISKTTLGTDAARLLIDGVITRLSIGFYAEESESETTGDLTTWTRVPAREFSLVPFPAYEGAQITTVREAETMTTTETITRAELDTIRAAMAELDRRLDRGNDPAPAGTGFHYRTAGEYLQAVASGDQAAAQFHRAFTGGTTSDTIMTPAPLGSFIKMVDERRKLTNTFSRSPLPASGMSVDYYQLATDTTKVQKQAKEGDALPMGNVTLKSANAPVSTYGGGTELSRQAIERATVPALDTTLKALGIRYAQVSEAATRAVYQETRAAQKAANAVISTPATGPSALTFDHLVGVLLEAVERYDDQGFSIGGLHVSKDVFQALAVMKDGDRRVLALGGASDSEGTLNLPQLEASLPGIRIQMLPGMESGGMCFWDPESICSLESPGAPMQLQDESIINLTKGFSLYGYLAHIVPFPAAIVPVKFAG